MLSKERKTILVLPHLDDEFAVIPIIRWLDKKVLLNLKMTTLFTSKQIRFIQNSCLILLVLYNLLLLIEHLIIWQYLQKQQ